MPTLMVHALLYNCTIAQHTKLGDDIIMPLPNFWLTELCIAKAPTQFAMCWIAACPALLRPIATTVATSQRKMTPIAPLWTGDCRLDYFGRWARSSLRAVGC